MAIEWSLNGHWVVIVWPLGNQKMVIEWISDGHWLVIGWSLTCRWMALNGHWMDIDWSLDGH
eukprot:8985703-Lingulodinium_polyedra.AAC.1